MDLFLPRSSRKTRRTVALAVTLLSTLVLAAGPARLPANADDLEDKKKNAHQNVQEAQADLEGSSSTLIAATQSLRNARAALVAAQEKLARTRGELTAARALDTQMQAKLVEAKAALAQAVRDVAAGEKKVTEQTDALGRLAVASYSFGDPSLVRLSVLLKGDDPDDIAVQLNTLDGMLDQQTTMLHELQATQALLEVQRKKVKTAEAQVSEKRQAAAANLERKKVLENEAEQGRTQVLRLVETRRQATVKAQAARAADKRKLAASRAQEKRIERLIRQRANQNKGGGYSGADNGFLLRPVPGGITSPYGYRVHPIYGYYSLHDGDDFSAPCGTPMRASATGTVISEYYSDVWGNRLYLDVGRVNGKSMTLIYNHISSYKARTGERVKRGDVVAYAGTTGWSTGCHLHFTVLVNGKAVNPQSFM